MSNGRHHTNSAGEWRVGDLVISNDYLLRYEGDEDGLVTLKIISIPCGSAADFGDVIHYDPFVKNICSNISEIARAAGRVI